jgi:hypothetical protein
VRRFFLASIALSLLVLSACGKESENESELKEEGLVGTTCYSRPVVRNPNGGNVCITPTSNWPGLAAGEFWYSLMLASVAKKATIEACKEANALDYGSKYGKSCYKACEEESVTNCLPFTPNPDV